MKTENKGFLFLYKDDPRLVSMSEGLIKNKNRNPPWLVVEKSIQSITLTRWPGELHEVQILDEVSDSDLKRNGQTSLLPTATYTRAVSVKSLCVHPLEELFGANGPKIAKILDLISIADRNIFEKLSGFYSDSTDQLNQLTWKTWLLMNKITADDNEDYTYTLHYPETDGGSPVLAGLMLIDTCVRNAATRIDGENGFWVDDENERRLQMVWRNSLRVLLTAAMVIGLGSKITEEYRERTAEWLNAVGI